MASNESENLAFITKVRSNSLPRTAREGSQQQSYYTGFESELDSPSSLISYTSLKDLIPSSHGSKTRPFSTGLTIGSAYEIPITNLLVKKAAWIYLQPMALPPDSSATTPKDHILCLAWGEVKPPVKACFRFIRRNIINKIASAFEKLLGAIPVGRSIH